MISHNKENISNPTMTSEKSMPDTVLPTTDKKCTETKSSSGFFYFIITLGILPCIVGGARVVWTSSALIKLASTDPSINPLGRPVTTEEISLMVGLPGLIALPASIIFAKLADLIGRKRCMQVIGFAMLFSLIGLAFSNSISLIITFLTCLSFLLSGTMCIVPIYFTEICEDHNRAKFGSLLSTFLIFGQLYGNAIGPFFSIRYYTLITAAPLIPFLILFFFASETPMYLCAKGKNEECLDVLKKLRKNKTGNELVKELNKITHSLTTTEEKSGTNNFSKLFLTKEGRFGLLLGLLTMIFQTISGGPVLIPLMAPIFNQYKTSVSGETVAVCISVVKVLSIFSTFVIIERVGRRPLLILSSVGSSLSMIILGTLFYFSYIGSPMFEQIQWLPVAVILFFYLVYGVGLCAVPVSMISVLFPLDLRSMSTSLVFTVEHVSIAICQLLYPSLAEAVGSHWCMWIFAINCSIAAIVFYWLMPETKGKSIDEIQKIFKNHRYF